MRAKKRARWARLFGAQFAVVTLFRKVLDLRPPSSLLSRGLPITKSMDMLRRSGACANSSSYLSRQKTRFAEARTCEVKRHFHISYNAPYFPPPPTPPQILHNLCFSFLLGITAVPREIENNAYAKFWGAKKVHYGKCGSGVYGNSFYRLEHNFVYYLCFLAILSTRERYDSMKMFTCFNLTSRVPKQSGMLSHCVVVRVTTL